MCAEVTSSSCAAPLDVGHRSDDAHGQGGGLAPITFEHGSVLGGQLHGHRGIVAQVVGRRTGCNDGPRPVDVVENAPSGAS